MRAGWSAGALFGGGADICAMAALVTNTPATAVDAKKRPIISVLLGSFLRTPTVHGMVQAEVHTAEQRSQTAARVAKTRRRRSRLCRKRHRGAGSIKLVRSAPMMMVMLVPIVAAKPEPERHRRLGAVIPGRVAVAVIARRIIPRWQWCRCWLVDAARKEGCENYRKACVDYRSRAHEPSLRVAFVTARHIGRLSYQRGARRNNSGAMRGRAAISRGP